MDTKQLQVLIIEKQKSIAEEIKKELTEIDFKVSIADSIQGGILRAKAYQFDLFVVNCGVSSKDGLNFAKDILRDSNYKNVPFIFTVNQRLKVDIRLRKFNHPFDILRLPVDATELRIRLGKLLTLAEEKSIEKQDETQEQADNGNEIVSEKGRVLLVEDNPLNQKVLGMFISKIGFEFDVASNGQMAIDFCVKSNYKFILMDIYMPGMDGTEATVKIRKAEEKGTHRAKIIAITANESEESVKRCYDSGMDDFMVKPFTIDLLKEKLV